MDKNGGYIYQRLPRCISFGLYPRYLFVLLDLDFVFRIDTSYCILYATFYSPNLTSYSYYLTYIIIILMTIPTQPHHIRI